MRTWTPVLLALLLAGCAHPPGALPPAGAPGEAIVPPAWSFACPPGSRQSPTQACYSPMAAPQSMDGDVAVHHSGGKTLVARVARDAAAPLEAPGNLAAITLAELRPDGTMGAATVLPTWLPPTNPGVVNFGFPAILRADTGPFHLVYLAFLATSAPAGSILGLEVPSMARGYEWVLHATSPDGVAWSAPEAIAEADDIFNLRAGMARDGTLAVAWLVLESRLLAGVTFERQDPEGHLGPGHPWRQAADHACWYPSNVQEWEGRLHIACGRGSGESFANTVPVAMTILELGSDGPEPIGSILTDCTFFTLASDGPHVLAIGAAIGYGGGCTDLRLLESTDGGRNWTRQGTAWDKVALLRELDQGTSSADRGSWGDDPLAVTADATGFTVLADVRCNAMAPDGHPQVDYCAVAFRLGPGLETGPAHLLQEAPDYAARNSKFAKAWTTLAFETFPTASLASVDGTLFAAWNDGRGSAFTIVAGMDATPHADPAP
ncbi:MAG TPA: hypothetical protein VM286_05235 [Candidatus Thermoplasmatota archaeon]|nr:hypothetical protein [Candidatus Thermoplasmatota archaeon]